MEQAHLSQITAAFVKCTEISRLTVKPVLRGHLKIEKTKVLMENGSLIKVESIAEHLQKF